MNSKLRCKPLKTAIFHLSFIYSGGGERLVLEEAKGLKKRGHEVTIFAPVVDRERCFPDIINQFEIKTFLPIRLWRIIPQWEAFQILLSCVLVPVFAHRFKEFDVILAANQPSPWLALWVKKLYRVPYVAYLAQPTRFLHPRKIDQETGLIFTGRRTFSPATRLMNLAKPFAHWADRISIKGADLVLANGDYVKGLLEKTYGVKVAPCSAGAYPAKPRIYADRFKGTLKIADKSIPKPFILLTNRHFPQKRFEYAITALPTILRDNPDASLVITGQETSYTRDLKNLVKQLSLEDKVVFLGLVTEKDLKKLYANAAVYVYTAPEEDFGMGMVEAMAQGTPVVAWNNAGPTGIVVDGKTGFLAEPLDVVDFADKISKVLSDKELAKRMGRAGWERVKEKFSYEKHCKVLEEAFLDSLKS